MTFPPHTLQECRWHGCPEHNPNSDPAYTPAMQWTPIETAVPVPVDAAAVPAEDIVTVCAWCPHLHILKLQRRDTDIIVAFVVGKKRLVFRNDEPLVISDGICEPCRAKHFPAKPDAAKAATWGAKE